MALIEFIGSGIMRKTLKKNHQKGTSLVELLVVIVIFTVGILAVVQIFPKGLGILKTSRNTSVANQLARAELERLKGTSDQLPDAILPSSAADPYATLDRNALPDVFLPSGTTGLQSDGTLLSPYAGGYWARFTGANRFRAIMGEGKAIPAPRFIQVGSGAAQFGGVMNLQFGPVQTAAANTFLVYGGDLNRRYIEDSPPRRGDDFAVYIDDANMAVYLPRGPRTRLFRLAFTYFKQTGPGVERAYATVQRDIVANPISGGVFYEGIDLTTFDPQMVNLDADSVRVQRQFLDVTSGSFSDPAAIGLADAVYEFKVVDPVLGVLLVHPSGFQYTERRGRGTRVPMLARVDYNVFDWRIIRDDFRIPTASPYQQKLILSALKVITNDDVDGKPYKGIGVDVLSTTGTPEGRDFVLVDTESGGVYTPDSYVVDKSEGVVKFRDSDNNASNGLDLALMLPGGSLPVVVNNAEGRSVRALYQAKGEWAVLPVKGATTYSPAWNPLITYDQCFPSQGDGISGRPGFVYFPLADVGKKVLIGEIYYRTSDMAPADPVQILADQEFIIRPPVAGDLPLGHIDLADKILTAGTISLDYTSGYAVRRVRGTSASVRVFWNPDYVRLTGTDAQNLTELNKWLQSLRRTETETFLTKGDN